MTLGTDLCDRCIDVYVYDKNREELVSIKTPEVGPKPEIKVEGTLLANTYQIAGKVTITNLERSVAVESAKYLRVEMYYKGATFANAIRKSILYEVTFADQSKQPPNRQVCFNCLVAGVTPNIMSLRTTIGSVDANGLPVEQTIPQILKQVIAVYNLALATVCPAWVNDLKLSAEPEFRMSASAQASIKAKKISTQWVNKSLAEILDSLTEMSIEEEPLTLYPDGKPVNRNYIAYTYYIADNKFIVAETPSNKHIPITGPAELELSYVLSAYRYGPQVNVRSLFDPRIHQDMDLSISSSNLYGKKVSGDLIPLVADAGGQVRFRPVGGIPFVFSTTGENWMQMQGVMYS